MATMIADVTQDIEGVKAIAAKQSKPSPTVPIPKSVNKRAKDNPSSANTTSIAARLRTHRIHQAHSTQVVLTSENDVRVLCIGGIEHVCVLYWISLGYCALKCFTARGGCVCIFLLEN